MRFILSLAILYGYVLLAFYLMTSTNVFIASAGVLALLVFVVGSIAEVVNK